MSIDLAALTDDRYYDDREEVDALQHDKNVELCIVSLAYTVVNPWAVMIVAIHTDATQSAVTAARRANHFTVWAETACLHSVKQFDKVHLWVLFDRTRIRKPHDNAEKTCCTKESLATPQKPFGLVGHTHHLVA